MEDNNGRGVISSGDQSFKLRGHAHRTPRKQSKLEVGEAINVQMLNLVIHFPSGGRGVNLTPSSPLRY